MLIFRKITDFFITKISQFFKFLEKKEKKETFEEIVNEKRDIDKKITVIGVGGSGNNTLDDLVNLGVDYVKLIGIETAENEIKYNLVKDSLLIGSKTCKGRGTGANPEMGKLSAEEDIESIKKILEGTKKLIIVAGFGGGTGTGATPEIAKLAKKMDIPVAACIIEPFHFEGEIRRKNFISGIERIKESVDYLITIPNDKLYKIEDKSITMKDAFKVINIKIRNIIEEFYDKDINFNTKKY